MRLVFQGLLLFLCGAFLGASYLLGRAFWRLLRDIGQVSHQDMLSRVDHINVLAQWAALWAYLGLVVAFGAYLGM